MSSPNGARGRSFVDDLKGKSMGKGNGRAASGNKARMFPGSSGAPSGYVGSWLTGFQRVDTAIVPESNRDGALETATERMSELTRATAVGGFPTDRSSNSEPIVAEVAPGRLDAIVADGSSAPLRSSPIGSGTSAASPLPVGHRSRTPPIYVWSSPSTPVTPEREWARRRWPRIESPGGTSTPRPNTPRPRS